MRVWMRAETRTDGFLDGRVMIEQPAKGYRAGADAVMLAAACPAQAGDSVLDLGCGAGAASLCLGWRVPGVRLTGIERQADHAALALWNAQANGLAMQVLTGDLAAPPQALRQARFDHVIANPPYFVGGTAAPDASRAQARHQDTALPVWADAALRRLRPGGLLVMILPAGRLAEGLSALGARAGDIAVLPIAARAGRDAGRVLIGAKKGARGPLRLISPLILHARATHDRDGEDLTEPAARILRKGAPINLW